MTHPTADEARKALEDAMSAAFAYVETQIAVADAHAGQAPLWHGWALREAFVAGVVWCRGQSLASPSDTPAPSPDVEALVEALKLALDYIEGCRVNGLPDLGDASRMPFMNDVLRIGDAALTHVKGGLNGTRVLLGE